LKIFRSIRKASLDNKKVINYLGYSISEIFLVVIGILIAVALNNCNEKKRETKELANIFITIKKDLENDILEIDKVLEFHNAWDPLFNKVLNDSLTKEDYLKNDTLVFIIMGYPEVSFDKRGFNLLSTYNSNTSNIRDTLVTHVVDFYTERLFEIKVDDDFRSVDFNDNFNHWKNNYDWWSNYIRRENFEGFINYALTSQDFKNRVATFYFANYVIFLPELKTFKEEAEEIINVIERRSLKK
jgi:hypothetical protein